MVAWMLRFIINCRNPRHSRNNDKLSTKEIKNASARVIKIIQRRVFFEEFLCLKHNKPVKINSKLSTLNPFLDEYQIIRVGGRLSNSNFSFDKKHPIVIPHDHFVTEMIIKCEHERLLHAGPLATLASVRNSYWPLRGRSVVKSVVRKCIKCFRTNPRGANQLMGDLPSSRLNYSRPFLTCGVDFAGPFS